MAPALLIDFRAKAEWVAGYLRCVLRTEGGGHRAEALDEVLAALTSDELRQLSRRAEEVAEARVSRPVDQRPRCPRPTDATVMGEDGSHAGGNG